MSIKDLMIIFLVFCVIMVVVFAYFFPMGERKRKRKKSEALTETMTQEEKKWQEEALRLKEYIAKYRNEIEDSRREQQKLREKLEEEKQKAQKVDEKLKHEKQWLSDQEASLDRRTKEAQQAKMELTKAQADREHEYSLRLVSDREKKGLQESLEKLTKEKNELLLKVTNLEFTLRMKREELGGLKKTNASLQKKKDEEQWVAKSEFERVEQLLKQKEKELQALQEERRQ
ncbi:MAG: hypothetical protein NT079_04755 [Candidatus Omnitrophica bacterium]|nr:hypothetical protein [Candidatus Omnitrophota bacterium]